MDQDKITFTSSLNRLEEIVEQLENPNLDLDEGLKLLEEGIKIHGTCKTKLEQASAKIKVILKDNPLSANSNEVKGDGEEALIRAHAQLDPNDSLPF